MQTLQIVITLASPVLLDTLSFFDGILAWCAVRDAHGDLSVIERLPLKSTGGVYHASWGLESREKLPIVADPRYITKRGLDADMDPSKDDLARYLDLDQVKPTHLLAGAGQYKGFLFALHPIAPRQVTFWAAGDGDEVRRLLQKHLAYLGAKGTLGFGRIENIDVTSTPEDCSLVHDGQVMRPIPTSALALLDPKVQAVLKGWPLGVSRVMPPYWARTGLVECFMPRKKSLPVIEKKAA
ncbi:MAG: hypothetical protein KKB70_08960 [Proteobacteria bacterium]|nr:hypothetical protein [Pseudomonadota bacterium]MBU1610701.1 hypothetical protein [Pseudomonadota bacterium]